MNWARNEFIKLVNRVFDETYEEVLRIRKITDLEQQYKEAWKAMEEIRAKWYGEVHDAFLRYHKEAEFGLWRNVDQGFTDIFGAKQYEFSNSPYQLLENIWAKASRELPDNPRIPSEKPKCYSCRNELVGRQIYTKFCSTECREKYHRQPSEEEKPSQKDWCWGCHQVKEVKSYTDKNIFKYCSPECYENHCGEYCFGCYKRSFNFRRDEKNPKLTFCLTCWDKKQPINHEHRNERSVIYCRYCHDKTDSVLPNINWCQKKECVEKEIARVDKNKELERERERESKFSSLLAN